MDPSYNNSFGGNNSGANPVPNSGATPPIGPAPAPAPIQSPTPPPQFSSDSGDIIINSAPKSTKKIAPGIIALIVIVIILLFAGIAFLIINRNNGGSGSAAPSAIKEAFNSYANYVLYGKDSTEDIEDITNSDVVITPYFESLNDDEKAQYITTATEKYNNFINLYYAEDRNLDDLVDTNPLDDYFQSFPRIKILSEQDVLDLYNQYGKSEATQKIKDNYNIANVSNNIAVYIDDSEELSNAYLDIIANIDAAGCIKEGAVIDGCYKQTEADVAELQVFFDITNIKNNVFLEAINSLSNLYGELYQ